MAYNEQQIKRVAFGNFTFPENTSGLTASTLSAAVSGAYIPIGAIVTGIKYFVGGTVSNGANLKNATLNPSVGGQVLGTNNRIASVALLETQAHSQAVVAAGFYVSVGGPLIMNIASSDSARTGIALDADVYVEYLYAGAKDAV
jgi:hypothetical protein